MTRLQHSSKGARAQQPRHSVLMAQLLADFELEVRRVPASAGGGGDGGGARARGRR